MTYKELKAAVKVFELGERATLKEIKSRHRELVKRYHPDSGSAADQQEIRKVNAAYRVLLDYVTDYRFSFEEEEFYEHNPEERLRRQFMDEALWGRGNG
jgi:curved DNA-binding protein CbpA